MNGVLIFLFQQFVQKGMNKSIRIEERKKAIVEEYLAMLTSCIEIVCEVDKKFRFREDMTEINKEFGASVSELCRYGITMDSVLGMTGDLEKLRAKCGYCHNRLVRYQAEGEFDFPLSEQELIIEDLSSIRRSLSKMLVKTIKE